jgi:hypothetical protein
VRVPVPATKDRGEGPGGPLSAVNPPGRAPGGARRHRYCGAPDAVDGLLALAYVDLTLHGLEHAPCRIERHVKE